MPDLRILWARGQWNPIALAAAGSSLTALPTTLTPTHTLAAKRSPISTFACKAITVAAVVAITTLAASKLATLATLAIAGEAQPPLAIGIAIGIAIAIGIDIAGALSATPAAFGTGAFEPAAVARFGARAQCDPHTEPIAWSGC